ncbi:NUDIX domain-containing protein [Paenarthrobacter nitroguajacolicus]|uniref:NUDIX domain-containing protein n=1 Tax=Paenarthrobacter nitroguajacolicus TaxID=211146 RepID=UPI003D7C14C9
MRKIITGTNPPNSGLALDEAVDIPPEHTVIAVIVQWRGRIALFRRSRRTGHDRGLWHCITGFLEAGATPEQQALEELREETGLLERDLLDFRQGPDLVVPDGSGNPWLVHTFTALTAKRRLRVNWEHDSYRWTTPSKARRFSNRVPWLDNVLDATSTLQHTGLGRQRHRKQRD